MRDAHGHREAMAVGDFLRIFLVDLEAEAVKPLAYYQALHPGHEEAIAREFVSLTSHGPGDASLPRAFGPYLLQEVIGHGGQAMVYRAEDTRLGREVALKVLDLVGADPEAVERLWREAEAASRLDHPAICTVFEAGLEGREPFIAMQRIDGDALSARITRRAVRRKDVGETPTEARSATRATLRLFAKVARGLEAAHKAGVLHRDVKPANIMINADEEPVIVDFGLARLVEGDAPTITREGQVFGTPSYIAPERLAEQPGPAGPAGDIWALGVSLFEALTLRRPFEAPTREGLVHAILASEPRDPRSIEPSIGRDLAVVLSTLLHKEPRSRYQTAGDVAEELDAILGGRSIRTRRPGVLVRSARWIRRSPGAAAALFAFTVACAALSGWYGYYSTTHEDVAIVDAQRVRSEVESHLEAAFVRVLSWDFEDARPHLERALELDHENGEAVGCMALVMLHQRQSEEALALLADVPHLLNRHPALLAIRAAAVHAKGGPPGALPEPACDLEAESHFLMAVAHLLALRPGARPTLALDAYEHARRAVIANRFAPRALFHFAASYAASRAQQSSDALMIGRSAMRLWPESALGRYATAHALIYDIATEDSGLEEAERLLETAGPRLGVGRVHYDLGVLCVRLERFDDAERALRETIRRGDTYGTAQAAVIWCLRLEGRLEEAAGEGRAALERYPNNGDLAGEVAAVLRRLGRAEEARTVCVDFLERAPRNQRVGFTLAEVLLDLLRPEEALAATDRAMRSRSRPVRGRFLRARALQMMGRHADAEVELRVTLVLRPDADGFLSHAVSLAALGRTPEAVERLDRAETLGGRTPRLLECRASTLFASGDRQGAARVQEELVAVLADSDEFEWLRKAKEALALYRRDR